MEQTALWATIEGYVVAGAVLELTESGDCAPLDVYEVLRQLQADGLLLCDKTDFDFLDKALRQQLQRYPMLCATVAPTLQICYHKDDDRENTITIQGEVTATKAMEQAYQYGKQC